MRLTGLSGRVLLRLTKAEACEPNPHLRDDYRIALITVLRAGHGSPIPHAEATYRVLGRHPDKVWQWIVAWRKAKLGNEYPAWYDDNGNLRLQPATDLALPPKKPVQMELCFKPREDRLLQDQPLEDQRRDGAA